MIIIGQANISYSVLGMHAYVYFNMFEIRRLIAQQAQSASAVVRSVVVLHYLITKRESSDFYEEVNDDLRHLLPVPL